MDIDQKDVKREADRLYDKFGSFAALVVDEILKMADCGYDYDAQY